MFIRSLDRVGNGTDVAPPPILKAVRIPAGVTTTIAIQEPGTDPRVAAELVASGPRPPASGAPGTLAPALDAVDVADHERVGSLASSIAPE